MGEQPIALEKHKVFVSYSREDLDFADQLVAALDTCGHLCSLDRHGIAGGEEWKRRLGSLIREADTVVFALSPASARSEICGWEVDEAVRNGKRIVPVLCRSLEGATPPERLTGLNYIHFCPDPKLPGKGFGTGLADLTTFLNTDLAWLREHTRYQQRASEWDEGGRQAARLLSGTDIETAKSWAARRPVQAPPLTALQLDYIHASELEAENRANEQRQQLEAMAAAQAKEKEALAKEKSAFAQVADEQRKRARAGKIALAVTASGLVLVSGLAIYAWQLSVKAQAEKEAATTVLEGATTLIGSLQADLDDETKMAILSIYSEGAKHGDLTSILSLCRNYKDGVRGVAKNPDQALKWCKLGAEKGLRRSIYRLGEMSEQSGKLIEAAQWYQKAADEGDEDALRRLGQAYARGVGVARDDDRARMIFARVLLGSLNMAKFVQANEERSEGKLGKGTLSALLNVSFDNLLTRDFEAARAAAEHGRIIDPNDLPTLSNLAHAEMFLGHDATAREIYVAHKGQVVKGTGNKIWEAVIEDDFEELRKAGLSDPLMNEIEKEFGLVK